MGYWLATAADQQQRGFIKRFDPRFWLVNFPRPMMAAVTTAAFDALRVDLAFYCRGDLAGLIWEAEDAKDHPLLAYETARDFRQCVLRFRWRSSGVVALDAVNGPTLTIEGRDAEGNPRAAHSSSAWLVERRTSRHIPSSVRNSAISAEALASVSPNRPSARSTAASLASSTSATSVSTRAPSPSACANRRPRTSSLM